LSAWLCYQLAGNAISRGVRAVRFGLEEVSMTTEPLGAADGLSRRMLMQHLAKAAGAAWLCLTGSAALAQQQAQAGVPCSTLIPKKSSQADVRHQVRSLTGKRCDNCRLFLPPDQCVVVEGPISADGSCSLWAELGNRPRGCVPDQTIAL
jgi:uncharacterized 2Fe-2S/4Fe-4S cluster protein (DUF4445 family)